MRKVVEDPFEPIPKDAQKDWDKLVREGKTLVTSRDKAIWKLILLSGQVEKKYGENRVQRFADEIGLSLRTMHQYRWMNRVGVDSEFIEKWSHLTYTVVREILRHTGKVSNPSTEYFLTYASERKVTVRAMQAFMIETAAPDRMRERAAESIKMALQDKQENEGFSDYLKVQLEKIAEEHPELEDTILRTAIVDIDDFRELKIAAGLATDSEEKMEGQAKYQTDKLKKYYTHLLTIKNDLRQHLEYGHEKADELRFQLIRLRDVVNEILEAEYIPPTFPAGSVEEMPADALGV